jgi:hypothetical protein
MRFLAICTAQVHRLAAAAIFRLRPVLATNFSVTDDFRPWLVRYALGSSFHFCVGRASSFGYLASLFTGESRLLE